MRFAGLVAACFLALATGGVAATPSPAPPGGPLEQLLAKARTASGSPYLLHVVSTAHETIAGRTYVVTSETEGTRYRARRCAGDVCSGFYFDGDRSFDTNLNDTALPLSTGVDGLQLTLRAIASYAFTAPDFRANGGRIEDLGVVDRGDGKAFRRVGVAANRGALLDAVVDPDSGLVAGVISDERKLAFEFRDQRRVSDRVTLPYEVWLDGRRVEHFDERRIAAEHLAEPEGLKPSFAPGASAAAFSGTGITPVLSCAIGGTTVPCLLDTGNSGLSMSLELSERLGIEASASPIGVQGLGRYVTGVAKGPGFTVGGATYPAASYVVLHDMHQYGYDLVLGADVLAHARVTVDYAKRQVTFGAAEPVAGGIPVAFENFIPVLPVHLGDAVVELAIDTGDESSINVAYDYYVQHPGLFTATGKARVGGIGGSSEEVTGELAAARVASVSVLQPKIGATKRLQATAHGHLGSAFLAHFAVSFDYAHGRVALAPRAGDAAVVTSAPDAR